MEPLVLAAFRDELQKIAGVSLDAGTRATMADRIGKKLLDDYLPGGELESNDPSQSNLTQKIAGKTITIPTTKEELQKSYKKVRDPAAGAMKGGIAGAFLSRFLRGEPPKGWVGMRVPAAIGAGAGLVDYMATKKLKERKPKTKKAMIGSESFTPGVALSQSRSVGRFQDKLVHKGDRLRPVQIGQKFNAPAVPGE